MSSKYVYVTVALPAAYQIGFWSEKGGHLFYEPCVMAVSKDYQTDILWDVDSRMVFEGGSLDEESREDYRAVIARDVRSVLGVSKGGSGCRILAIHPSFEDASAYLDEMSVRTGEVRLAWAAVRVYARAESEMELLEACSAYGITDPSALEADDLAILLDGHVVTSASVELGDMEVQPKHRLGVVAKERKDDDWICVGVESVLVPEEVFREEAQKVVEKLDAILKAGLGEAPLDIGDRGFRANVKVIFNSHGVKGRGVGDLEAIVGSFVLLSEWTINPPPRTGTFERMRGVAIARSGADGEDLYLG